MSIQTTSRKIIGALYPSRENSIGLLYYKDGDFYIVCYSNFEEREIKDIKIESLEDVYAIMAKNELLSG